MLLALSSIHILSSTRYAPSAGDAVVYGAVGKSPDKKKYPNAFRWFKHIASYGQEVSKFPGEKKSVDQYGSADAAAASKDDDDDDVDLFGSDEEEVCSWFVNKSAKRPTETKQP